MRPIVIVLALASMLLSAPTRSAAQSTEVAALASQAKQAMAENRFDEAAGLYRKILQQMPDEPGIMMNLGMALSMAGKPREAIAPLSRALELRPSLLNAALFLGQSHVDLGQ